MRAVDRRLEEERVLRAIRHRDRVRSHERDDGVGLRAGHGPRVRVDELRREVAAARQ